MINGIIFIVSSVIYALGIWQAAKLLGRWYKTEKEKIENNIFFKFIFYFLFILLVIFSLPSLFFLLKIIPAR